MRFINQAVLFLAAAAAASCSIHPVPTRTNPRAEPRPDALPALRPALESPRTPHSDEP